MILYIEHDIIRGKCDTQILKDRSVYHKIADSGCVVITPQKIILDEYDMNILFDEAFYDCIIEYINLGHEDFCLQIK